MSNADGEACNSQCPGTRSPSGQSAAQSTLPSALTSQSPHKSGSFKSAGTASGSAPKSTCPSLKSDKPPSEKGNKEPITVKLIRSLHAVREPLAEYQERNGTPRDEMFHFVPLINMLGQSAYNVTIAVLVMLYSFVPLLEGFLYCVRFILDKLIDILESGETKDKVVKGLLFLLELLVIFFVLFLIISFIVWPVFQLTWSLFGKVWHMLFSFTKNN